MGAHSGIHVDEAASYRQYTVGSMHNVQHLQPLDSLRINVNWRALQLELSLPKCLTRDELTSRRAVACTHVHRKTDAQLTHVYVRMCMMKHKRTYNKEAIHIFYYKRKTTMENIHTKVRT